jgi:TfoX/Sxy family transcriptional regulator of competence genes
LYIGIKKMAQNEVIAEKVRLALASHSNVGVKKMFGSLAFMVNGHLCLAVGKNRIMCRIDPALSNELTRKDGVRLVNMRGKDLKGYVYVDEKRLQQEKELSFWIKLALDFNQSLPSRP